jgi:hypothetical protein
VIRAILTEPASEDDCQAKWPGASYNSEDRSCLAGNNENAYARCLASCPQVVAEPGRCEPWVTAAARECTDTYVVIEWASRERGSCESWYRGLSQSGRRSVTEGQVPWCEDWEEANVLAVVGLVVLAVVAVLAIVAAATWEAGDFGPMYGG